MCHPAVRLREPLRLFPPHLESRDDATPVEQAVLEVVDAQRCAPFQAPPARIQRARVRASKRGRPRDDDTGGDDGGDGGDADAGDHDEPPDAEAEAEAEALRAALGFAAFVGGAGSKRGR